MSVKLLKRSDIVLGYMAQFLNLAVGIIVLPAALRTLAPTDLNFWLILNYVYTFSALMESSFSPNISRNITFVLSGLKELVPWGFKLRGSSSVNAPDSVDWTLYKSLIKSVNIIYLFLSIFLFIILNFVGTPMITSGGNAGYENLWYVYLIAISAGIYFGKFAAVTTGWGHIGANNIALISSKLIYILLSFLSLYFGFGIKGLVYSFVVQAVVARLIPIFYWYKIEKIGKYKEENVQKTLVVLLPNSFRTMLTAISGFAITRGIVFVASSSLGGEVVAPFTLSHQVVTVVCSVAVVFVQLAQAQITKYSAENNREQVIRNLVVSLRMMILVIVLGALTVTTLGQEILEILGSKTLLAGSSIILLLFFVGLLETNHSLFASFIMAKNEVPFVVPAAISALCIIAGAYWMISVYQSLVGAIFIQLLVQAAFNNWYWPKVYLQSLNLRAKDLVSLVFRLKRGVG